jgi:hypothetical protein
MKRTIILAITFVCLFAQMSISQQPYRSLKECSNDTAKYLKYNFKERGSIFLYEAKTFAQLYADLEIKPIGLQRTMMTIEGDGAKIVAIDIFFTQSNKLGFSVLKDEYISIGWETPIIYNNSAIMTKAKLSPPVKGQEKYESGYELFTAYPKYDWIPQYYDFFKDQKIKTVFYSPVRY